MNLIATLFRRPGIFSIISALALLSTPLSSVAQPKGAPDLGGGERELGKSVANDYLKTADDEKSAKKNEYFDAEPVTDQKKVLENQKELFGDNLLPKNGGNDKMDKYYAVHLRDLNAENRAEIQKMRDESVRKRFLGGAPEYIPQTKNSDFRLCCVRRAEKNLPTWMIVNEHRNGDGWSALAEVNFPSRYLRWGYERITMTLMKDKFQEYQKEAAELRKGDEFVKYAEKAIGRLADQAEMKKGSFDPSGDVGDAKETIKEAQKLREQMVKGAHFSSDVQRQQGIEIGVLHAAMLKEPIDQIGQEFCLGKPDSGGFGAGKESVIQFGKIMDPDENEDPHFQKPEGGGGDRDEVLWKVLPYCSACKNLQKLMFNYDDTAKLMNVRNTPTDLSKSFLDLKQEKHRSGYERCVVQKNNKEKGGYCYEGLDEVMKEAGSRGIMGNDQVGGKHASMQDPVPVAARTDDVDARNIGSFVLAANIAAGLQRSGEQKQYYKHWEPQPYRDFKGKALKVNKGEENEFNVPCKRKVDVEQLKKGTKYSDSFAFSYKHKDFLKDPIRVMQGDDKGYNWDSFFWSEISDVAIRAKNKDGVDKKYEDKQQMNYGASMPYAALCPKGWVVWQGWAADDDVPANVKANFTQWCGKEEMDGKELP